MPNDTITFTPASGTYSVEYPLGTLAISSVTSAQTLTLASGGHLRVLVAAGSVAFALTDKPDGIALTTAQVVATQALVSGDGNGGFLLGGVTVYPTAPFAWSARPAAAGNETRVIKLTDYGNKPLLISDGTNWLPLVGGVTWKTQAGTIANPISAFTGVTSSIFTTDQAIFPAGLLVPGRSIIEIEGLVRRVGANANAVLSVHFGTAKSSADGTMLATNMAATSLLDVMFRIRVAVQGAGAVGSTNYITTGGNGTNAAKDQTGNINTAADMGVTVGVASANAADSFALIQLSVSLLG
jgi:hypothetical protein